MGSEREKNRMHACGALLRMLAFSNHHGQSNTVNGGDRVHRGELLRRFLVWDSSSQLLVPIRSKGQKSVRERSGQLWADLLGTGSASDSLRGRVEFLECDLSAPGLGLILPTMRNAHRPRISFIWPPT